MDYKGLDIIKKRSDDLYWVIYKGSMMGSAKNVECAKLLIDELTYCEV